MKKTKQRAIMRKFDRINPKMMRSRQTAKPKPLPSALANIDGGIDVQCVYNKKHKKTLSFEEANRGMPLCEIDGGPMMAVRATIRR